MSTPPLPIHDDEPHDYDAVLVVSFGGPEGPDDVLPFLDNVFRGVRGVTDETKARIAERYQQFGGVSPINAHTRAFIDALKMFYHVANIGDARSLATREGRALSRYFDYIPQLAKIEAAHRRARSVRGRAGDRDPVHPRPGAHAGLHRCAMCR